MTAWPGAAMPKAIHLSELRVSSVLNMMTYWLAPMVQRALYGLDGNDELDGREGNDHLRGGAGADVLRGGEGDDTASYWLSDTGVEVRLYDGVSQGGDAEGDTFTGMKTIEYTDAEGNTLQAEVPDIEHLNGSTHDDILAGAHGSNWLWGDAGNDELDGREGNDWLNGAPGNDTLYGGGGDDYLQGAEDDDELHGQEGNDQLHGDYNGSLFGEIHRRQRQTVRWRGR